MNVPAVEPGRTQDHDAPGASSSPTSAAPGSEPSRTEPNRTEPNRTEPTGVGPAAGGSLRASDSDRDQVAVLLDAAYAEGRLTHEEHDERLERVLVARTFDDLIPLTADLVPLDPTPATVSSTASTFVVGNGSHTEVDRMVAVFGGVERKGRWRVRARSQVMAIFGGVDLDLREADFDAPVVELNVSTCFGGVDIKVPAGINVRNETVNIFGGTDVKNLGEPIEGAPTLVIKGTVFFGGVDVKGPRPKRWGRGTARPGLAALDPRPHTLHQRLHDRIERSGR
ncbi:Cell wall-active antibiotics response 4TMS YvqF [Microlunatus flavus]|uniref:Cell wall-active antibiotics response 4TMS YvqF n=2 Tax=Microlunatus flavus TaxID=1036181 RepID=A0A1H9L9W3_9ACTN|nr:Cell wall-active antibiotics response 4TMS YvqF [Microlunatus flavus]